MKYLFFICLLIMPGSMVAFKKEGAVVETANLNDSSLYDQFNQFCGQISPIHKAILCCKVSCFCYKMSYNLPVEQELCCKAMSAGCCVISGYHYSDFMSKNFVDKNQ